MKIVAPRVGAWIETNMQGIEIPNRLSRPVWARGLKHGRYDLEYQPPGMLRPAWARGLNHNLK